MQSFDVLGEPVRRRILKLLAEGEHASGELVAVVQREFGITPSAVSQHLKVLRESGFATVRVRAPAAAMDAALEDRSYPTQRTGIRVLLLPLQRVRIEPLRRGLAWIALVTDAATRVLLRRFDIAHAEVTPVEG